MVCMQILKPFHIFVFVSCFFSVSLVRAAVVVDASPESVSSLTADEKTSEPLVGKDTSSQADVSGEDDESAVQEENEKSSVELPLVSGQPDPSINKDAPLVILIHGSKGKLGTWYKPGGEFYDALSKQAELHGFGQVFPFSWSGKSGPPESRFESVKAHIQAAEDLVEKIVDLTKGRSRKLILVGHSNGGVISMLVSHMLYNPAVQGSKAPEIFKKLSEPESKMRVLLECRSAIKAAVKYQQSRWKSTDIPFVITELFTMGTPIDTSLYTINPSVIRHVYVLFSAGDSIQRFFGRRHYPRAQNSLNIRVSFQTRKKGIVYPWHTYFCNNNTVARYLFDLPAIIQQKLGAGFARLKGVDVLLPMGEEKPLVEKIDHWKYRSFRATGFY